ncbi:VWA domain-containing protein [Desulfotruncus alcoholivorax]|uniref:VWA domain-containing protein n=1 Tax=Desulfotruncus alcoholivorax TaxID=265477 RepID=UPI0003F76D08|nr:VWA domain-containing protein [Desulfotruncus alcoholivorax]
MQSQISRLMHYLGEAGLKFSTSEIIDFYKALDLTGLNYDQVEAALLCTLAKDKESYLALPALLKSFILSIQAESGKVVPPPLDVEYIKKNPPKLPAEAFSSHLDQLKNTIRNEIIKLKTDTSSGTGKGVPGNGRLVAKDINHHVNKFLTHTSNRAVLHSNDKDFKPPVITGLWQIDIATANSDQLHEISKIIINMGSKLAAQKGYSKKPAATGGVAIRRTVKKAIACGGIPLTIKKEKRAPAKPEIVVMCDLSGSVAPYSQFFLQILTGMQHRFKSVHSFAFVDRIEEITDIIKSTCRRSEISAQSLVRELKISATGFSNYGKVWEQFNQQFLQVINHQTSLVILGDARNNWQPDGVEHFRNIVEQCRRVIWLNPLAKDKWNTDDCILDIYAVYCNNVFQCANAAQLAKAIKKII